MNTGKMVVSFIWGILYSVCIYYIFIYNGGMNIDSSPLYAIPITFALLSAAYILTDIIMCLLD